MKRFIALSISVLGALGLLGSGTAAYADGAEVVHNNVKNETVVIDFTNPCTGQAQELTLVQSGSSHITFRPHGTVMFFDNFHGTFTASDGTSGTFVAVDVTAGGANGTVTTIIRAKGTTPSGDRIEINFHFHLAQNGNGEIVVEFAKGC